MNHRTIPFMRGMNFGFAAPRGWYASDEALAQIHKMKELNIDWVAAHVTFVQEAYSSTRVFMDYQFTPDDREVVAWIKAARAAGLKVMLKPILEPLDGVWRGYINPPEDQMATYAHLQLSSHHRSRWTPSFKACLAHYAGLAAEAEADCLCLGVEYWKLESYNDMWREIIADARTRYPGLLTYEFTPHGVAERSVYPEIGRWWSELDFLGFSAYGDNAEEDPTLEQLMQGFAERKAAARALHEEFQLPLALLETGRRSTRGPKGAAHDFQQSGVYDGAIQARYLEAVALAFQDEPWYRGCFWWKWDEHQTHARPHYYTDPAGDQGFTIAGKPAAETLRKIYAP